jgi:uncharacterized protein (TIGR02597 family)
MKSTSLTLAAAAVLAALPLANAQNVTATTDPVGFVTIDLPVNSDTIIAAPLTKAPIFQGSVSSRSGFTISVSSAPNWSQFTNTYLQVVDGSQAGMIFDIASNTGDSLTLVNNGVQPTGLDAGAQFKLVEYWTLGTLFPASSANVSFTPSSNTLGVNRRTQILFPDTIGTGINRAPTDTYFFTGTSWRKTTASTTDANNTPILPETYFIVRNPSTASSGLKLTVAGSVSTSSFTIPLDRLSSSSNDNYVSISRPMDVALNDLGLISSGAFVASSNTLGVNRRDQLLVFSNNSTGLNKAASSTYYYVTNSGWRSTSTGATDVGTSVIPAGSGLVIRKYQNADTTTQFWSNPYTAN